MALSVPERGLSTAGQDTIWGRAPRVGKTQKCPNQSLHDHSVDKTRTKTQPRTALCHLNQLTELTLGYETTQRTGPCYFGPQESVGII